MYQCLYINKIRKVVEELTLGRVMEVQKQPVPYKNLSVVIS